MLGSQVTLTYGGSKKVLFGHLGRVEFPAGQVTSHSHLSNGHVVCQLGKKSKLRLA